MFGKIVQKLIIIILIGELVLSLFFVVEYDKKNIISTNVSKLYKDENMEIPIQGLTKHQIEKTIEATNKIYFSKNKRDMLDKLEKLYSFQETKHLLYSFFDGDNILIDIDAKDIVELDKRISSLDYQQQQQLVNKYNVLKKQYSDIIDAENELNNLFTDSSLMSVKVDISREEKDNAYKKLQSLPQKELFEQNLQYLDAAEKYIIEREKREQQAELARQYAIRKAQEEAIKKAEEEKVVQEAYVELANVQYINQRVNKVYNGCEAASLLMALQYKGYLFDYNLYRLAEEMPKHDSDAHQGFIHSIFDMEPNDVTHWIAPDALANFGSRYAKVTNVSGISGDEIKRYIDNNIPVIVYATYGFREVTKWDGEIPLNLHVMLVIGYNKITGAYVINDPWAGKIIIKKENFEKIYNIKKYAVVVE